jgi:hypothetical protein
VEQCTSFFVATIPLLKVLKLHPNLFASLVLLDGGFVHGSGTVTITTGSIQIRQLKVNIFALRKRSDETNQLQISHLALRDSSFENLLKGLVGAILVLQIDHCDPHIIFLLPTKGQSVRGWFKNLHLLHGMILFEWLLRQQHEQHQYLLTGERRTCIESRASKNLDSKQAVVRNLVLR